MDEVYELSTILAEEQLTNENLNKEIHFIGNSIKIHEEKFEKDIKKFYEFINRGKQLKNKAQELNEIIEIGILKVEKSTQILEETQYYKQLIKFTSQYLSSKNTILINMEELFIKLNEIEKRVEELSHCTPQEIKEQMEVLEKDNQKMTYNISEAEISIKILEEAVKDALYKLEDSKGCMQNIVTEIKQTNSAIQVIREQIDVLNQITTNTEQEYVVLEAQNAGILACKKGKEFRAAHHAAFDVIAKGLIALGIIKKESEAKLYFMHGTSHYLGLDVHDAGTYQPLLPGVVMTVEPGFGGQSFIENTFQKLRQLVELRKNSGSSFLIEVDGGVNGNNAHQLVLGGADVLVAGNYVFGSPDPQKVIAAIKNC